MNHLALPTDKAIPNQLPSLIREALVLGLVITRNYKLRMYFFIGRAITPVSIASNFSKNQKKAGLERKRL